MERNVTSTLYGSYRLIRTILVFDFALFLASISEEDEDDSQNSFCSLRFFFIFYSTVSWFDLNYIFGESSDTNTSPFIPGSSVEGPTIPKSYDGRGNDDHAEEVVSGFHPHHKESLLLDLNKVSIYLFFWYSTVNLALPFIRFLVCCALRTVVARSEQGKHIITNY
ncbi:hypothetical protein Hanom_Chr00s009714g01743581 [Helianthus anomalus]